MLKQLQDFVVENKKVLVRCDFNVPLSPKGEILDDFKIRAALPTIKYLVENQAKVILMSHLDDADTEGPEKLDVIQERLKELLNMPVQKTDDCIGEDVETKVLELQPGQVLLLENVRLHQEEIDNDQSFAKALANLGEIYINDAFAVCHRSHASVVSVPKYLPHGAGFLLEKEIESLTKVLNSPARPLVALIGGKKLETKAKFIDSISKIADTVIINGLIKQEMVKENITLQHPEKIISPLDHLDAPDISAESTKLFQDKILTAKTIFWNGPFGKCEDEEYKKGTLAIAKAIIESKAFSVVGGGETVEFLDREGLTSKFSHVSTGGGAMLDFLSGDKLPGLVALG